MAVQSNFYNFKMAIIKKIKLPNNEVKDIGALSSNIIYDGVTPTITLNQKISSMEQIIEGLNSFEIAVVNSLPTQDIDDHTIYFVPQSQGSTTHDEYMYINNTWELIGTTTIDLSDYVTYDDISITQGLTTGIPAATITIGNTSTIIYSNKKWNDVNLSHTVLNSGNKLFIPVLTSSTSTSAELAEATTIPLNYGEIVKRDTNNYIYAATPTAGDKSNKVATTSFVADAITTTVTPAAALTTGITIGSIDVNGTTTTFYAPESKDPVYYVEIAVEDDPENEGEYVASFVNDDTFESILERIENGEDVKAKINNNAFMNLNIEDSFISFTSVDNFNSGEISINTVEIDTNNNVYAYTDHIGNHIKLYEASYNDKTGTFSVPFIRYSNIIRDLQIGKPVYINLTCVAASSGDQEETNILYKCEGTHYGGFPADTDLIFTHQRGNGIVDYIIFPSDNSSPYMGQYDFRTYVDSQINAVTSTIPSITVTQGITTGIEIGSIDVDGTTTSLYAPEDTKVTQTDISAATVGLPVLLSPQKFNAGTITDEAGKTQFQYNPSKNRLVIPSDGDNNGAVSISDLTSGKSQILACVIAEGTSSTHGVAAINIGNKVSSGDGNSAGALLIFGQGNKGNNLEALDNSISGGDVFTYMNYLPMVDEAVLAAGVTTGVGSSTVPVYMAAGGELLACTLPTSASYSLSMSGATITLLADNVAASTITLPIYDGTVIDAAEGGSY